VFDGELVAFADGQVDFVALSERVLLRTCNAPIAFIVFDVLYLDGSSTMGEPYRKRRAILESLGLAGPHCATTPSFDDADALWRVVLRDGLEGMVAKPRGSVYRPGERGWLKIKNRAYWKYDVEREFAVSERREDACHTHRTPASALIDSRQPPSGRSGIYRRRWNSGFPQNLSIALTNHGSFLQWCWRRQPQPAPRLP
jgi:hypothetical protein